jgi:hypothetical protein
MVAGGARHCDRHVPRAICTRLVYAGDSKAYKEDRSACEPEMDAVAMCNFPPHLEQGTSFSMGSLAFALTLDRSAAFTLNIAADHELEGIGGEPVLPSHVYEVLRDALSPPFPGEEVLVKTFNLPTSPHHNPVSALVPGRS